MYKGWGLDSAAPVMGTAKTEMNSRVLVLFLAFCICASVLYTSIVYLNTERRGANIINAVESSKLTKYDCENANCQHVYPAFIEHSTIEEPRYHQNYKTSSHIHPETSTRSDSTTKDIDIATPTTRADPASIAELGRKELPVPFDPYATDTMVYMHIQKTGGSEFLEHVVTAQIPLERVKISNNLKKPPSWPKRGPNSQLMPLCRTSPTGGWKRRGNYLGNGSVVIIHHELCPRDWEHPNGNTWLVSEKTTAWTCGVHAFYTDFKRCLQYSTIFNHYARKKYKPDKSLRLSHDNRFHYVVILRHPLLRYISEYLHVSRGACWAREDKCSKKGIVSQKRFRCPEDLQCKTDIVKKFTADLTLAKFLRCTESWSINRMTLSLADHELATCWDKKRYSREQRDQILLASAKSVLCNISYFGLNEFIAESGSLFEKTFGLVLKNPIQAQSLNSSKAGQFIRSLMQEKEINIFKKVVQNNLLDLELYEYALDIFRIRMRTMGIELDTDTLNYIQTLNDAMHRVEL